MPPPTVLRRAVPLALAAALLAGCSGHAAGHGLTGASGLPTPSSVARGRFVATVDLDNGGLTVTPPPATAPRLSAARADAMFRATDAVQGTFPFSVFGLGVVTISPDVAPVPATGSSTTTTTPAGAGTTTSTSSTGANGTTTSAATTSATTTSAATTSTTTITIPGVVPGASPPLPTFDRRLAWVGIVWGGPCPSGRGVPTTTGAASGDSGPYTAVVIDADTGTDAIAYTSAGPPRCGAPASTPVVSSPAELVSVPWHPVGPASTAVHVSLPACATYYGWTQVPTGTTGGAVQVVARVPYAETCATGPADEVVDSVVPLGSTQSAVPHAALGPVDAERTLAGG